jgi:broad specificity phosphatase PhoE
MRLSNCLVFVTGAVSLLTTFFQLLVRPRCSLAHVSRRIVDIALPRIVLEGKGSTRTKKVGAFQISFIQHKQRHYHHLSPSYLLATTRTAIWFENHRSRTHYSTISSVLHLSSTDNMSTDGGITTMTTTNSIEGPVLPPLVSTSKRIFWIRHGEVINPGGTRVVYYGAQDVMLSDFGKLEAQVAAQYLQQFTLHNVYSSTLSRAIYGATKVINSQQQQQQDAELSISKMELVQLPGLTELDRGKWCGLTIEEIGRDKMKAFDNCDESVTPEGGESYNAVKERVINAKNNILQQMKYGTCAAAVCHLQVTRCIVSDALQIPTNEMVQKVSIATASITCIDYNSDGTCTVHYQSFKPATIIGLEKAKDGAN